MRRLQPYKWLAAFAASTPEKYTRQRFLNFARRILQQRKEGTLTRFSARLARPCIDAASRWCFDNQLADVILDEPGVRSAKKGHGSATLRQAAFAMFDDISSMSDGSLELLVTLLEKELDQ